MATSISEMSDKDLRAALKAHGKNPGPILESTRDLYEKQLTALLHGKDPAAPSPTAARKQRRQTFDSLRRAEKPKVEPRVRPRSERPAPITTPLLSLSDSDTELPDLSLSPERTREKPSPPRKEASPPQSLSLSSRSPRPSPRQPRKSRASEPAAAHSKSDPSMFSDEDPDEVVKLGGKKIQKKKSPDGSALPVVVGAVLVAVVGICLGYTFLPLTSSPANSDIPEQCSKVTSFTVNQTECDGIWKSLKTKKIHWDLDAGMVICGDKEGSLYHEAPRHDVTRRLLWEWRDDLNLTFFIRRDGDNYINLNTQTELKDFDVLREPFFYSTTTPHLSWSCWISRLVSNFAYTILSTGLVLVMAQIAHKVYHWRRTKEKQETGQMYELIDQIIEELQRNYSKYLTDPKNHVPYVPIPHARDRLLLPCERSSMKHIWEKAVQFIAQHESRVRVEMRRVQSEDFPVWYWVEATKSPSMPQPDSTSPDFLYPVIEPLQET